MGGGAATEPRTPEQPRSPTQPQPQLPSGSRAEGVARPTMMALATPTARVSGILYPCGALGLPAAPARAPGTPSVPQPNSRLTHLVPPVPAASPGALSRCGKRKFLH